MSSSISAQINRQDSYCNITYIGNAINADELVPVKDTLNNIVLNNDKHSVINFDSIFIDDKSSSGLAMQQKLQVNIAAKNSTLLKDIHFTDDDNIIVVISNTEHNDAVVNILKTILK